MHSEGQVLEHKVVAYNKETIQSIGKVNTKTKSIITIIFVWVSFFFPERITAQTTNLQLPNGKVEVTLDKTGRWGVNDGTAGQVGFTYNGSNLLHNATTNRSEAGLMLGLSASQVSDVVKTNTTTRSTDLVAVGGFSSGRSNGDFKEVVIKYKEAGSMGSPIGVEVIQRTYGWNTNADQGLVIVEYRIKNTSTTATLQQLSVGLFADWNLGTRTENRADWDAANKLGYVYESGGTGTHAGIALLTAQTAQYYAFDQDGTAGSINVNDGLSKSEKYQSMSGNLARAKAGETGNGNDVAHTVGARLITLAPGETGMVAFALVAGASLTELQTRIQTANTRFKSLHTSLTPTLPSDLKVCGPVGETTLVPTGGGTKFRFYDQIPTVGTTTPLSEGSELRVQNIQSNRTIYVTSVDSLFEGTPASIQIRYVYPTAGIADGLRELCVGGNLTLEASVATTNQGGTLTYQWQRGGQNIGGNTSRILINEAGTYKLIVTKEGCSRSSAEITLNQVQTPVITQNGTRLEVNATGAQTYQWFYNNLPLTGANAESFAPQATGAYTVQVGFGNGCEVTSGAFQVEVTGLASSVPLLVGVKAYPIPNPGRFTLELPQDKRGFQVSIIDFSGRKLGQYLIENGGKHAIHLPINLPIGIYFLKVQSKQQQAILKLAIQR